MGKIIDFPTFKCRKPEDQFITVLLTEEMHVCWNRSQLFYIKSSIYPLSQRIFCYVRITRVVEAQAVAAKILENIKEANPGYLAKDTANEV